jgi:peptide/nickel transport system permease protein
MPDRDFESYWVMIGRRFCRHRLAVGGLALLALIVLMAVFAPLIAPYHPYESTDAFQQRPSGAHWLGTDAIGRDVLSRLIYGSRVSLLVGFGSVLFYSAIGIVLGGVSGYFGGWADIVIMRVTEIFQSFPRTVVILVVAGLIGPSIANIILLLGVLSWPSIARLVRGDILAVKSADFVKAAVVLQLSPLRIVSSHILPNILSPIFVNATFGFASAILIEATLSFLGVGVQPPIPSWGNMLTDAQSLTVLSTQLWMWVPPGVMIMTTVLSINFVGDGLRDALDPREILS